MLGPSWALSSCYVADVDGYVAAYLELIGLAVMLVDSGRQIRATTPHTLF